VLFTNLRRIDQGLAMQRNLITMWLKKISAPWTEKWGGKKEEDQPAWQNDSEKGREREKERDSANLRDV
jgi:hypothetical protein